MGSGKGGSGGRKISKGDPVFNKKPICEVCGKKEATIFTATPEADSNQWKFECDEEHEDIAKYYVPIDQYFSTPCATVDWHGHLNEKTWMDWKDFMDMMRRFRQATNCFNS